MSEALTHEADSAKNFSIAEGIERLDLVNFRNYDGFQLNCAARHIVLTGNNGVGKTNILEALSLLAPGRGFRNAKLPLLARQNKENTVLGFQIEARVRSAERVMKITMSLPAGGQKRKAFIDGCPLYHRSELSSYMRVNWLLPQMDRLFLDGQTAQRRFLDRMVYGFEPDHASHVSAYEALLRQRQKLLKSHYADADWLDVLERRLARRALPIIAARNRLIDNLNRVCAQQIAPEGCFPEFLLSGEGTAETLCAEHGFDNKAEELLQKAYREARGHDKESHRTWVGPQRFTLKLYNLHNKMFAEFCSTGEQKILLISLVLGQMMLFEEREGPQAILLLDEIVAHLDLKRREALFERLQKLKLQAFYTGTEQAVFSALGGKADFFVLERDKDGIGRFSEKSPSFR